MNNSFNKNISIILLIAILLLIANITLLILLQSSRIYYRMLEHQIVERNELIQSLYNNNLVLDVDKVKLLNSVCLNDSISAAATLPKKITDSESRIINGVIQHYIETIKEHNLEEYADMFTNEVPRFFLRDSVSNRDIYYHMQWYWKTYPNIESPIYNLSSISIDKESSNYIIFIPSKKGETEIITEIKLNSDFKIYYIRDYHAYIDKHKKK